jgi:Fe-S-cluster containining protein
MFQCTRCGICCQNLVIKCGSRYYFGLFLLPEEKDLFPVDVVAPYWGTRKNGKFEVRIFQLNTKKCPHQTAQNTCGIYERRPLICRAHPLTIHTNPATNQIVGASLDVKCPNVKGLTGIRANMMRVFPRPIVEAAVMVTQVQSTTFSNADGFMVFDLGTNKWVKLTVEVAVDIFKSPFL